MTTTTAPLTIDRPKTALLLMDFQNLAVERVAVAAPGLFARTARVIAAARTAGVRVMYVVVGFRPGLPEVSPRNASFSMIKSMGVFAPGSSGVAIHPDVAPAADEIIVTKHRTSAFHGTDLDMILRANGIERLVLCGIATSGVVLSTLRHAADADYACVVVKDACADFDEEVHRVLTEKVFVRQATVVTCDELISALV
jgi:nicotinamidase-related amidase